VSHQHSVWLYADDISVTLDLPPDAAARLEAEAARRGITLDELVAELSTQFPQEVHAVGARRRLRLTAAGASTSGRRAADAKQILIDEGFGIDSADR
jgi:hypothetical protein